MFVITESQGDKEEEEDDDIPSDRKLPKSTLLSKISATTIKSVLEVLCDESVSEKKVPPIFIHYIETDDIVILLLINIYLLIIILYFIDRDFWLSQS